METSFYEEYFRLFMTPAKQRLSWPLSSRRPTLQCQQWFQGDERRWREHNVEMMKSNPVVSTHQELADIALDFLGGSWRNKRLAHQAWYEVSLGLAGLTRPP
ncbi:MULTISPECIES: hypothetical protein [unclassified Pseudomonas]|uniref:hypothetical protein n=1 Tax=unclassified Pseudomonas TaxID=196821 RepID=UPI000B885D13|nr:MULTISPECIES: hypothetical protein [unclassified Pseudomonas]